LVTNRVPVYLVRHGATEWSLSGRHTGTTDVPLTTRGEVDAASVGRRLALGAAPERAGPIREVWTSPRIRAWRTAEVALAAAGFPSPPPVLVRDDLVEWDYGAYEGLTSAQIADRDPAWTVWARGGPGGESPHQVSARADRVLADLLEIDGPVAVFSHGHFLRALSARWVGLAVEWGRVLTLGAGALCVLDWEHGDRILRLWNQPPG
jgi:broad specificity phosphatase PhoE